MENKKQTNEVQDEKKVWETPDFEMLSSDKNTLGGGHPNAGADISYS